MQIHTDVTTLSRLYPLFKAADLEGVLSGDYSTFSALTYPGLCAALLAAGSLPEICSIITRSEHLIPDNQDPGAVLSRIPWAEASREDCMGVVVPFLIDITVGPLDLKQTIPPVQK